MPKLSLAKLEHHLYSAADRLRQEGLDAATYKDYIFGMLFLKRCSDVFEAEHDRIVGRKVEQGMIQDEAETRYDENPDYYDGFFAPALTDRAAIRPLVENDPGVQARIEALRAVVDVLPLPPDQVLRLRQAARQRATRNSTRTPSIPSKSAGR
jgi:type I restriction-modification system DNA methylase subunit